MTGLLFKIGMFPWLMSIGATLFFTPSWPRFRREGAEITGSRPAVAGAALGRSGMAVLALYAIVQVLIPLRHVLYPGNTLWTEEGFRFAWRVMLIEKGGELSYLVVDSKGQRTEVSPRAYLTPFQTRMCATQPDMILQLAQVVARDFEARGAGPVQVFADARTSFNGRPNAVLIDPRVDLARETDGFRAKTWIMPAPTGPPEF